MDSQTIIFGDPQNFAFEIQQGINPRKGYLRMLIKNIPLGDFKRQCDFINAVFDYRKFIKLQDDLYEDIFTEMSPKEIYEYALAKELVYSDKKEDWNEASRRQKYIRFYGDQFDSLCGFHSLVKGDALVLIVTFHGRIGNESVRYDISLNDYHYANAEFIEWFNSNLAGFYPSYKQ